MEEKVEVRGSRLITFEGVSKFKSIKRAIRREHVSEEGFVVPQRPFNNRGNSSKRKNAHSRDTNEYKKQVYGQLIARYRNVQ